MATGKPKKVSQEELDRRKIVGVGEERVTDITSTDYPGHFPDEDNQWDLDEFKKYVKFEFYKNENLETSFSLIGVDASIANAFRRIMIAEVPTVAIEYAYITNNTSVIQDEVLAARIGLVPLAGDPDGFDAMTWYKKPSTGEEQQPGTIRNTLAFVLEAECTNKAGVNKNENDPAKLYNNANVYAKDIRFIPSGDQVEMFPKGLPRPQNPDILLVKMRPGQCIAMDLHAVKGIGADHAKFSPVATASYRLLPTIDIIKPIIGDDAKKFARCFPRGVIELESVTETDAKKDSEYKDHVGEKKAVVKNTFIDTVSRECLRHDEFKHKVKLGRVRDHFIYNVESTGQYDSDEIFLKSIKILHKKCDRVLKYLEKMEDEASFKELAGDS